MKSEGDRMDCYICGAAPIRRICLADEIISNKKFLFCDTCRKQQILRKHGSQIYEIDSYSTPVSLMSINCTEQQQARKVQENVESCRLSAEQKIGRMFELLMGIEEKILKKVEMFEATFNPQTAQQTQEQLKNHSSNDREQILKKVMVLKWFKENKQLISNTSLLSQKISDFTKYFQEAIQNLYAKIEGSLIEFFGEFNMDNFFVEKKKDQKFPTKQKEHSLVNRNVRKIKAVEKLPIKKPLQEDQIKSEKLAGKLNEWIKQEKSLNEQDKMELENQNQVFNLLNKPKSRESIVSSNDLALNKIIFPSYSVKDDINIEDEKQKQSSESKLASIPEPKPLKKKPSKAAPQKLNEQQAANKPPSLVLQKVLTKYDYRKDEKLIISLKNIAEIFWILNKYEKKQKPTNSIQDSKIKYENGKLMVQENFHINSTIDTSKTINLREIKYLEVRELPKRSVEIFSVNIDGNDTKIKYSIQKLYEKIIEMENLEQLHIFTSILLPSEEQLLTVLFTCSNIKVVSFCCFNPTSKMLPQFKDMIGNQFNQQIKVLEMAGNIPFYEDIEIADVKCYFPESEKNKKIYDEKFAKYFETYVEEYLKYSDEKVKEKQKFEHRNSCWFIPHNKREIQHERISHILTPTENNLLNQCFKELRSCWIPYMSTEQLTEKQSKSQLQKIQHLTLGFHNFVLQSIPEKFYFGQKNDPSSVPFCKFLTNLKSLNIINLNLNEFFMRTSFCPNWKELISLKIQNCMGLSNTFFTNLPKFCPKLRKICVNNLHTGIQGDFLTKLQDLETIILPWSELSYNRSQKISEIESNKISQIEDSMNKNGILAEDINSFKLRKWKYLNLYGCSWFHTDFFALIDPESLKHLNIGNFFCLSLGKCKNLSLEDLVYYLKRFRNLQSLCLDEIELNNKDLFSILKKHPKLIRLSVAHCPNLNFGFDNLDSEEFQILDRMTHLDLRNWVNHITFQYTMKMRNPKYLMISRGFQLEENEPQALAQRQIAAYSSEI